LVCRVRTGLMLRSEVVYRRCLPREHQSDSISIIKPLSWAPMVKEEDSLTDDRKKRPGPPPIPNQDKNVRPDLTVDTATPSIGLKESPNNFEGNGIRSPIVNNNSPVPAEKLIRRGDKPK